LKQKLLLHVILLKQIRTDEQACTQLNPPDELGRFNARYEHGNDFSRMFDVGNKDFRQKYRITIETFVLLTCSFRTLFA